jgi:ParB family chromosome partitioning protein
MTDLVRYDAACRALAEAKSVDEVKDIRDRAIALREYARRSHNRQMEADAFEIRQDATRKLGEMLAEQKKAEGLNEGGRPAKTGTTAEPVSPKAKKPKIVPAPKPAPPTLAEIGITKKLSSDAQKLAAVPEEKFKATVAATRDKIINGPVSAGTNAVKSFSGDNEYYTPAIYVEAARQAMGGIDLDPATCAMAQETVRAGQWFTKEDDGLAKEWHGRVWMNPPYASGLIDRFARKLIEEAEGGRVSAAVVLVDNRTDTAWFHTLARACSRICFTKGRINFYSESTASSSPANGSVFFYFGSDPARFEMAFARFGFGGPVSFVQEVENAVAA